jgi:hypothetical protein
MGCAYPAPFDNGLYGPQTPQYDRRTLVLVFQQEGTYQPAAGAAVRVEAAAPARLISPAGGRGLTNSYGELTVVVAPAALYDESVLKQGDIVIDYPVDLAVTMIRSGRELGWSVSDNQSFARYRDPLYQGLNRDPDPQPGFMTLTLP